MSRVSPLRVGVIYNQPFFPKTVKAIMVPPSSGSEISSPFLPVAIPGFQARPVTDQKLLKIGPAGIYQISGKPLIVHQILELKKGGITDVIVVTEPDYFGPLRASFEKFSAGCLSNQNRFSDVKVNFFPANFETGSLKPVTEAIVDFLSKHRKRPANFFVVKDRISFSTDQHRLAAAFSMHEEAVKKGAAATLISKANEIFLEPEFGVVFQSQVRGPNELGLLPRKKQSVFFSKDIMNNVMAAFSQRVFEGYLDNGREVDLIIDFFQRRRNLPEVGLRELIFLLLKSPEERQRIDKGIQTLLRRQWPKFFVNATPDNVFGNWVPMQFIVEDGDSEDIFEVIKKPEPPRRE